ncbi:uncharacterized protein LOC132564432 [Ylistrum balloti]|uniref:uncharacterized protein LOC132564432 n=1 Tax=Ylistrum balloti TaxID=509963 RepID=UPI002905A6B5|nr:uncharacterized protein LOC132564432 [Ylistrum balloti]
MKDLLGGKGANLAEIAKIGIPVPPGFTITTEACAKFNQDKKLPESLVRDIPHAINRLGTMLSKKFGNTEEPLLVSVRSGAAVSMPGMMDTILNLGLNDKSVKALASSSNNERFAWDAYRRLINMFGNVVYGMNHHTFELALKKIKEAHKANSDTDLDAEALKEVVAEYKLIFKKHAKKPFPQNPLTQLQEAIVAVFNSWNNERAITYRSINNIKGLIGTAVNVQSMVFGNFGDSSGTGVAFTRDASTGEKIFYGEYLMNAQGEDVVAGIRTPKKIETLNSQLPKIYKQLIQIKDKLEKHYRDMQDIEFTIENNVLYILQTRSGKRTGNAAIKIAVDMVKEKLISKEEAVLRVSNELFEQVFHPQIDDKAKKNKKAIATGSNASPGAAVGAIVLTSEDAQALAKKNVKTILVREQTSPEDIGGMNVVEGILTSTGGMTSHAAVVARGMGTPCIVGCSALHIEDDAIVISGKKFPIGTSITLDGSTGEIYAEPLPLVEAKITDDINTFLSYADELRKKSKRVKEHPSSFAIRANADTPADARHALKWGAQGIGLCRTEHMFFGTERIRHFRELILASDSKGRSKALSKLLPMQRKDFFQIMSAMEKLPVTIRLLDPPLHEFLPQEESLQRDLAKELGIEPIQVAQRTQNLHEHNPMMGHRGCRLGITYPEIYDMQVQAITEAVIQCKKKGIDAKPEIMIPLVGTYQELEILRKRAEAIITSLSAKSRVSITCKIGTMIEIPRAAVKADEIAQHADFFSFGTNDLTQLTFGYSREDIASFLPYYLEADILTNDPFQTLDSAVAQLVTLGTEKGRSVNKGLSVGICGEHGGDPASIAIAYHAGLSYVSCSPFRIPIARLAIAQEIVRTSKQSQPRNTKKTQSTPVGAKRKNK